MKQGDIVVLTFPFADLSGSKLRPAVVLSNTDYNKHHNVILAGIYGTKTPLAIALTNKDLVQKKLQKDSFISVQNIFSADKTHVLKVIDSLTRTKCATLTHAVKMYVS